MQAAPQGSLGKAEDSNLYVISPAKPFSSCVSVIHYPFHTIVVKHSKGKASRQHFKLDEVGLISPLTLYILR